MSLHASLFPHQQEALPWLKEKELLGCILADDMGLGKTVMCCALMCEVIQPTIVIAPASLVTQWVQEVQIHTDLTVEAYIGQEIMPLADVIVTSHNRILMDFKEMNLRKYGGFRRMVIDEAHRLKNRRSATSEAIKHIFDGNHVRKVLLTGTPICNDVNDMVGLLLHTNRTPYNDYDAFWYRMKRKDRIKILKDIREEFLLRRTKESKLAHLLPSITVNTVKLKTNESIKSVHEFCKYLTKMPLVKILRMRQSMNHIQLLQDAYILDQDQLDEMKVELDMLSQKVEKITNIVQSVPEDDKVVIFSQWKGMMNVIQDFTGMNFLQYHGGMDRTEKAQTIERFRNDPMVKGLIISLRAGGCGLNLVEANHAIITEPYWNYAEEKQAIDRIYRIGQSKPVFIHRMLMHATVENWMNMKQQKKKRLADKMVDNIGDIDEVERDAVKEAELFMKIVRSKQGKVADAEIDEILAK